MKAFATPNNPKEIIMTPDPAFQSAVFAGIASPLRC